MGLFLHISLAMYNKTLDMLIVFRQNDWSAYDGLNRSEIGVACENNFC